MYHVLNRDVAYHSLRDNMNDPKQELDHDKLPPNRCGAWSTDWSRSATKPSPNPLTGPHGRRYFLSSSCIGNWPALWGLSRWIERTGQ